MRLVVEGNSLFNQRSGVAQYTKRLVEAYLDEYPEADVLIVGFRFFTKGKIDYPIEPTNRLKYRIIRWLPARVYNQLYKLGIAPPFDLLFRLRASDIIFLPNFVRFPLLYNRNSLLAVHDLSYVYTSQYTQVKDLPYKTKFVPRSIKKSTHILTISESSKKQIVKHYDVESSNISIVYPGVDTTFFYRRGGPEVKAVRTKYSLPDRYIVFVGTLEPRKNITGLLEAYESLDEETRGKYGLVLAGGSGWKNEGILKKIEKLRQQGTNVILTGYVPDADLPAILSGSTALVFPTFYEGFGIPPLEAMACGVPVISANNSSLPEVVGQAGVLVDANKTIEIVAAIKKLLGSKALRDSYIKKGYEQAKSYNWKRSANQLYETIKALNFSKRR